MGLAHEGAETGAGSGSSGASAAAGAPGAGSPAPGSEAVEGASIVIMTATDLEPVAIDMAGSTAGAGGASWTARVGGASIAADADGAGWTAGSVDGPAALAGTKMDSDSGEGLTEGLSSRSRETPTGMACRVEPIFASVSAASLSALGTWWNSQTRKR